MRSYFLGDWGCSSPYPIPIIVNSLRTGLGHVASRDRSFGFEKVLETESYAREFKKGEYLNIDGSDYEILKVSHNEDGTVIYKIDKNLIFEDAESKAKAEADLLARGQLFEEIERNRLKSFESEADRVKKSIHAENLRTEKKSKKWYQYFNLRR